MSSGLSLRLAGKFMLLYFRLASVLARRTCSASSSCSSFAAAASTIFLGAEKCNFKICAASEVAAAESFMLSP